MTRTKKIIYAPLLALLIAQPVCALDLVGKTFFSARSQGSNGAHRLAAAPVLWDMQAPHDCITFATAVTGGYQHSYKTEPVANHFFSKNVLNITGSQVATRGSQDLLADYFGLSPAFSSNIFFNPEVSNAYADFSAFINCSFLGDAYLYVHVPVVHTKRFFGIEEAVHNNGSGTQYPAEYMSVAALTAPATSATRALQGGVTFGDVSTGLLFGKISGTPRSLTRVADVHAEFAWYLLRRERAHIALGLCGAIPTGNRPKGEYLFEPMVGNGHHPELGVSLSGHFVVWEKDADQTLGIHCLLQLSHLFRTRQVRSFDLRSRNIDGFQFNEKFASRYILVKEFNTAGLYTGVSSPLINHSTLQCHVTIPLQIEGALMAAYRYRGLDVCAGYNIWARTDEHISCVNLRLPNNLGLKGIQNAKIGANNSPVTQSKATIFGNPFADQAVVADGAQPVFIHPTDLDPKSAAHDGVFSHKFFLSAGNAWNTGTDCCWHPYVGVGGEIEFIGQHCPRQEQQYYKVALAQWGVWATLGINY